MEREDDSQLQFSSSSKSTGGVKKKKKPTNDLGINHFCALKLINPFLGKVVRIIYKIISFNSVSAPAPKRTSDWLSDSWL